MREFILIILFCGISVYSQSESETESNLNIENPLDGQPIFNRTFSEYNYPYFLNIRFDAVEENTSLLLNEITLKNIVCHPSPEIDCFYLSIFDIMAAINMSSRSPREIAQAISNLNISQEQSKYIVNEYHLNWNVFTLLLDKLGITVTEIYNYVINNLPNANQKIPIILDILNIDRTEFSLIFLYGSESEKRSLLSKGNYTWDTINKVIEIIDLPTTELLTIFPIQKVITALINHKIDEKVFINFLKKYGITSQKLELMYSSLNLNLEELYTKEIFQTVLDQISTLLNKEKVIGTAISQNEIMTSSKTKDVFAYDFIHFLEGNLHNYYIFQGHLEENDSETLPLSPEANLPEILSQEIIFYNLQYPLTVYLNISLDYNETILYNCTYPSKSNDGKLYFEELSVNVERNYLAAAKSPSTRFVLGTPIICDDRVQGVAKSENETALRFSPLLPISLPSSSIHSSAVLLSNNVTLNILIIMSVFIGVHF